MPRAKKAKEPVTLFGIQYVRNFLVPRGKKTEETFQADSIDAKDVIKAADKHMGWGIGAMCKIYKVEADGSKTYLYDLLPDERVTFTSRGRSVKVARKPLLIDQEDYAPF